MTEGIDDRLHRARVIRDRFAQLQEEARAYSAVHGPNFFQLLSDLATVVEELATQASPHE